METKLVVDMLKRALKFHRVTKSMGSDRSFTPCKRGISTSMYVCRLIYQSF